MRFGYLFLIIPILACLPQNQESFNKETTTIDWGENPWPEIRKERIKQLRMAHLFEEPCPLYEPEWEEDHCWDCRLTYDYDENE